MNCARHFTGNWVALLPVTLVLSYAPLRAQDAAPREGVQSGNYNLQQAIEFGYRHTDFTGSGQVYGTFVNLNPGPRLFEHTLAMRSLNHRGLLFDDFFLTSFGYGGDPNDVSRLRMYKNRRYNFNGAFRRDRNLWDYNLLANPLNPANSNPSVPISFSPHGYQTTRRMSDFGLTLLPQSRVRFRAGYSRNIQEGPTFTSFHEGTEVLLFQPWKTTMNSYQAGVDFKVIPRTNFSYDQFWHFYKGDTTGVDRSFGFRLADGTPVDLGLIFNTPAGQPCAAPVLDPTTVPPIANPRCTGYLQYTRAGRVRTSYPTEQFSFQSKYFKALDLSGRLSYSSSDSKVGDFSEFFRGLIGRTNQREFSTAGPARARRVSLTADWAGTLHVSERFRIADVFHFTHFRIPGTWLLAESSLFGTSMLVPPNAFSPSLCPPPFTGPGCPQHNASSPADIAAGASSLFLGQNLKSNQVELQYDLAKGLAAKLGYRFRHRTITLWDRETASELFYPMLPNRGSCAGRPLESDGSCRAATDAGDFHQTEINEHALLVGIQSRLADVFRLSSDLEVAWADNTFTRISPRQLQHYKFRVSYKPTARINFAGSVNILENRNNVTEINNLQHNRSYGFSAVLEPHSRLALDVGYDYNDTFSQTNICFVGSLQPLGSTPCPTAAALLEQISFYNAQTHFGDVNLTWKLHPRVSATLGYNILSTNGHTLILNPNAPSGPLQFNYHRPHAGLAVDLAKGFTWRANWGYYGYNEKASPGPGILPRDFRGNLVAVSLRHSF